ncbi:Sister chromatid cohesion PDS5 B-B [Melia azedarach]|uniref:Sister chromatid cohesion PDS5 B-B n=1 Tax=Melia azedarach TaxID=155640 RepID=A0ACC1X8W2_MELAZ|nr:Sister chromatid cohesion PDS5 B-B [Melia azedarach]
MAANDRELERQLLDAGNRILEPPEEVDELLPLLDRVETCLSRVEQSPSQSMQNALSPSQRALVADKLLRHEDVDVKVAVASCISEITRITAPDAPYDDEQMKEIFQLIVSSFENLADQASRSYTKRTSILETVAKVRSCVVMLDLECDALILEMFQHFLNSIRDDHPENVFSSMETIMNLVLEESEEIPLELLSPILAHVKRDTEDVLPVARRLAEKVLETCAAKLKPCLLQAVKSSGISLDDYTEVVASICQEPSGDDEQNDVHVSNEQTTDENESKSPKEPLDEAPQVDTETATEAEAASTEQVEAASLNERSLKSVVNNGISQCGKDDSLAGPSLLKKQEHGDTTDQSKSVDTLSNAEPDNPDVDESAEDKSEQSTKRRGKKPNSSIKLAEPSDSSQIDGEKENEGTLDHKTDSKVVANSSHEEPATEGAVCSENEKETVIEITSPKATEGESIEVPPSPSGSIPNEIRAQRPARSKKKESLLKQATASADDASKKASEGTSDSEAKPHKRAGKQVLSESANEDKASTIDTLRKESGASSDSEAKPVKQSSKKVDSSSNNGDGSSLKQSHDKRKREKSISGKDATRSSTKEDKDTVSSPKAAAKSIKGEQHVEETPKTNSKRKRAPGKEKASDAEELRENLVGSKVKVWWPKDRMFYEGVIDSFDPVKKKHKVCYNDGDEEILNLKREKWELLGGDSDSDEGEAADHQSPDTSSEMPLKKKVKTSSEQSSKQKKGGGASSSKSRVADSKSGRKFKDEIKVDGKSKDGSKTSTKSENDSVSKTKDHASKSSGKSVDAASKSASKSKNDASDTSRSGKSKEGGSGMPKTSSKSKQETPKTSKSKQETPKVSSNAKGKSPKSVGKSNANGTGKSKASSIKVKEDEDMKDSTDSTKVAESTKGKSSSPSKTPGSEAKSGKKRRRGSKV